jgi:hypothetical protein
VSKQQQIASIDSKRLEFEAVIKRQYFISVRLSQLLNFGYFGVFQYKFTDSN